MLLAAQVSMVVELLQGEWTVHIRGERSLLIDRGYSAFSYAGIAETVKIRKASIHHHFPTKAGLVVAVLRRHRARISDSRNQPWPRPARGVRYGRTGGEHRGQRVQYAPATGRRACRHPDRLRSRFLLWDACERQPCQWHLPILVDGELWLHKNHAPRQPPGTG